MLAAVSSRRVFLPDESSAQIESPSFDEFAKRYREYARANKRGFYNERYRLEQLAEHFGKRKLSELKRWDAENLKIEFGRRVGPATVNRLLGNLKHMLSMAVEWNVLPENPFVGVKLLHVSRSSERILREDEEKQLLPACDRVRSPYLRASVAIALNTGMRKGEIFGLRWQGVDLANRSIRVLNGKTLGSDRRIPMNNTVFEVLSDLQKKKEGELIFPSFRKPKERFRDPKKAFTKAVQLAEIPHLRFHDLRHTFATRLVRAGTDLVTVQHLLGHSKITTTTRCR